MNKKTMKLQNLLFPQGDRYAQFWRMFFNGERLIYSPKMDCYLLPKYHYVEFSTYFNSFSFHKWKRYTHLDNLSLHLVIKGDFHINLVGYYMDVNSLKKETLGEFSFQIAEPQEIVVKYPKSKSTILAFELTSYEACELYGGGYYTEISEEYVRNVDLAVATTTFKKEAFITSNMELLKEEILNCGEEISEHFYIHVIDNGRSLKPDKYNSPRLTVHPNNNVGGSGGFTRGMLEALDQNPKPTHVLLMDDDVIILPESIKRTYNLLKILKDEYRNAFVSGAMLYYEQMDTQHEDVGYLHMDGSYGPRKHHLNFQDLYCVVKNEERWIEQKYSYAGWWYCCIPMTVINDRNLPLPLFVRGDDVEYSLRNHAKFITLNGICIWHMGFTLKFNAAMELYQVHRNSLILQAVDDMCKDVDLIERIRKFIRVELLRFNYDSAELLIEAIEDFLKGPEFLKQDLGEKLLKEKSQKNEKMEDLSHFPDIPVNIDEVYHNPERTFTETLLYRVTYNGHFWPRFLLKKKPGIIAHDWFYSPKKQFFRRKLLAVNPHMKTGAIREISTRRFLKIYMRSKRILRNYKRNHLKVEAAYRSFMKELTSRDFWENYLELKSGKER